MAENEVTKDVLTMNEAVQYTGMTKAYLYKLTMLKKIPHYKPMGKLVYFDKNELREWLLSNRVATTDELTQRANLYCQTH